VDFARGLVDLAEGLVDLARGLVDLAGGLVDLARGWVDKGRMVRYGDTQMAVYVSILDLNSFASFKNDF
jgi:hypothetical protein